MSIEVVEKENKVVVEGLERGNGHTLGVALRRTLLNQLTGAAPIAVRMKDVDEYVKHEFSTIKGVRENVLQIILNIKKIRVELLGSQPQIMKLEAKTGSVRAGEFITPNEVRIINPDIQIANLDAGANITIEVIVARGKGYMLAEEVKSRYMKDIRDFLGIDPKLNIIYLDALFSPVRRVNYKVSEVSHPLKGNYEILEFEIDTDGSITPREAIKSASTIVAELLSKFAPDRISVTQVYEEPVAPVIEKSILELGLDEKIVEALKSEKITTLSELKERWSSGALKAFLKEKDLEKIEKILER